METLRIYHNPRCSKSRGACQMLEDQGIAAEIVDYLKNPPLWVGLQPDKLNKCRAEARPTNSCLSRRLKRLGV